MRDARGTSNGRIFRGSLIVKQLSSEELDKKIKISRIKLEESRLRTRGLDDVTDPRTKTKALKVGRLQ